MENCLQDNLRIITQEMVSQRALNLLSEGRGQYMLFLKKFCMSFFFIINEFMAAPCFSWTFSGGGSRGYSSSWCTGLLIAVVSLVAEHRL